MEVDSEAWVIRVTRTKTLTLVADAALEAFVKSDGYVQVSSALTAGVASCTIASIMLPCPSI